MTDPTRTPPSAPAPDRQRRPGSLRLRYFWLKARGWLAWQLVRGFPLPRDLHSLRCELVARLWGVALYADAVESFADYRDIWYPIERGSGVAPGPPLF